MSRIHKMLRRFASDSSIQKSFLKRGYSLQTSSCWHRISQQDDVYKHDVVVAFRFHGKIGNLKKFDLFFLPSPFSLSTQALTYSTNRIYSFIV